MGYVAIIVDDYDRAIERYTDKLGVTLIEDTPQPGKQWCLMSTRRSGDVFDRYAKAVNDSA